MRGGNVILSAELMKISGQKKVVPGAVESEYREGCQRRTGERQHDAPVNLQEASAIYFRRVLQFIGNRLKELLQQKCTEDAGGRRGQSARPDCCTSPSRG